MLSLNAIVRITMKAMPEGGAPTLRGTQKIVRCGSGHLYRTAWVPFVSFKAIRWFGRRLQWCPVGKHWSWAERVEPSSLSAAEYKGAYERRDSGIW